MRALTLLIATFGVVAIIALPVNARLLEDWPYERLFKEADVVVIAKAGDTSDTKDRFSTKGWKIEFIGQDTKFLAQSVLKGKTGDDKKLTVLHYRLPEGVQIENGPLLVRFRKDSVMLQGTINGAAFKAGLGRPEYMLFLRLRKDGRYEPVSGEIDPSLSVRELHSADGFFADLGKK
jgi:hypothetical protein